MSIENKYGQPYKQDSQKNITNPADYFEGVIDVPVYDWLFTLDQIQRESPSRRLTNIKQRIGFTEESQKRAKGIVYLFACSKQLRLSRCVALTASILFHRFYMKRDFTNYHYFEIAATCLFIASKSEECRRKLSDVVKVCASIALTGRVSDKVTEESKIYWKWKDVIVNLEELVLEVLCFDVTPLNPYKICFGALNLSEDDDQQNDEGADKIFSTSINYLELLSRLPLSILFPVDTICGLGFVLSCASSKTKLSKYSFDQFEINLDEVWKCYCTTIKLAQNLEKLRQPFPILAHIPKLSHESLIKICDSVDAGGERETTGI